MKESDINIGMEGLIRKFTPQWGIRLGWPDEEKVLEIGDELMTDIIIIHGINPSPPKNEKGQFAIRAKKVRTNERKDS